MDQKIFTTLNNAKTCVKQLFKKAKTKILMTNGWCLLNEGRKYCRMLQGESESGHFTQVFLYTQKFCLSGPMMLEDISSYIGLDKQKY